MDYTAMDAIVTSSTSMISATVEAFFHFLTSIWPILIGVVFGVGLLFGIYKFLASKIGSGGSLFGGGRRRR